MVAAIDAAIFVAQRQHLLGRAGHAAGGGAAPFPSLKMLWVDAHGDFQHAGDDRIGYLGGMALAGACGLWESGHGSEVMASDVAIIGIRDIDRAGRSAGAASRSEADRSGGRAVVHWRRPGLDTHRLGRASNPIMFPPPTGSRMLQLAGRASLFAGRYRLNGSRASSLPSSRRQTMSVRAPKALRVIGDIVEPLIASNNN